MRSPSAIGAAVALVVTSALSGPAHGALQCGFPVVVYDPAAVGKALNTVQRAVNIAEGNYSLQQEMSAFAREMGAPRLIQEAIRDPQRALLSEARLLLPSPVQETMNALRLGHDPRKWSDQARRNLGRVMPEPIQRISDKFHLGDDPTKWPARAKRFGMSKHAARMLADYAIAEMDYEREITWNTPRYEPDTATILGEPGDSGAPKTREEWERAQQRFQTQVSRGEHDEHLGLPALKLTKEDVRDVITNYRQIYRDPEAGLNHLLRNRGVEGNWVSDPKSAIMNNLLRDETIRREVDAWGAVAGLRPGRIHSFVRRNHWFRRHPEAALRAIAFDHGATLHIPLAKQGESLESYLERGLRHPRNLRKLGYTGTAMNAAFRIANDEPGAHGAVKRLIVESGGEWAETVPIPRKNESAERYARRLLVYRQNQERLGLTGEDAANILTLMRFAGADHEPETVIAASLAGQLMARDGPVRAGLRWATARAQEATANVQRTVVTQTTERCDAGPSTEPAVSGTVTETGTTGHGSTVGSSRSVGPDTTSAERAATAAATAIDAIALTTTSTPDRLSDWQEALAECEDVLCDAAVILQIEAQRTQWAIDEARMITLGTLVEAAKTAEIVGEIRDDATDD